MLLDILFIGNKFQGPRNLCTCMADHFEYFVGGDTTSEDVQFAVGPLEPSSPHSVPETMTRQDGFKALRVQRLLEPGFVRCPEGGLMGWE